MKKAISHLTFLFVLVMLIGVSLTIGATPANAATYSGTCGADGDNLSWSLDTSTGTLTIDGEGEMASYSSSSTAPWYSYNTDIINIALHDGITSIGSYAFYKCTSLSSIAIPNSITSIGGSAFLGCTGMTEVHISDIAAWCNISFTIFTSNPLSYAHNLYLNNELVTELDIPDSVTSISNYAFYGCTSLTDVSISNSVSNIARDAFSR